MRIDIRTQEFQLSAFNQRLIRTYKPEPEPQKQIGYLIRRGLGLRGSQKWFQTHYHAKVLLQIRQVSTAIFLKRAVDIGSSIGAIGYQLENRVIGIIISAELRIDDIPSFGQEIGIEPTNIIEHFLLGKNCLYKSVL